MNTRRGFFALCLLLLTLCTPVLSASKPDPRCLDLEMEVLSVIEKYEDSVLAGAETLIDIATLIEYAKTTCASGDVESATIIYKSTLSQLDTVIREMKNPTDIPEWLKDLIE